MTKILISTSLFYYNNQSIKYNNLYKNIIDSLNVFKDYQVNVAIYYDKTVPDFIINDLKKCDNVILVKKNKSVNREGCFWRYEAYDDFDYDIYFFRDIDISLEKNDLLAINNFINSDNKVFYIFIVHPRRPYPKQGFIMGGIFGIKKNSIPSFKELLNNYKIKNTLQHYGSDEEFLAKELYALNPPLVFIEPRVKNAQLTNTFFNTLKLKNNYETYIYFKNNYVL